MNKIFAILLIMNISWVTSTWADDFYYICDVETETAISSIHLENAPPPKAEGRRGAKYEFWIKVTKDISKETPIFTISEIENKDSGIRNLEVCGQPHETVLFGDYVGDGWSFTAVKDQGFFYLFGSNNFKSEFKYYHSGFEYPGCEDRRLVVRYGNCTPRK